MSSIAILNSQLHRAIKPGNNYNKFFGNAKGKEIFLGTGKTTFGLHKMKDWTDLHYLQTLKLAKFLKGNSIKQTSLNIKSFLFNHIQYSADGLEQNLRSPNNSWLNRQEGIDCKSFSVLAGSILKVLKIPFKYRKITQPMSPENWSHVYVVVNDELGREIIIDATIVSNNEVPKIKKEDLIMEADLRYVGLNGASDLTEDQQDVVSGFRAFLADLNSIGVPLIITERIEKEVRKSTDMGIDPKVSLNDDFIVINNVRIDYGVGLKGFSDFLGTVANSGADAATGNILGSITGLFSGLFGSKRDQGKIDKETKRLHRLYTFPKIKKAQAQAQRGDVSGAISYLEGQISFEHTQIAKFKSPNSKAAVGNMIIEYTKALELLTGVKSQINTQQINTQQIKGQGPQQFVSNSGALNVNALVKYGVDNYLNPATGQVIPAAQVAANQSVQNSQGNQSPKNSQGMSTTKKVAIATGVVVAITGAVLVAKEKNII